MLSGKGGSQLKLSGIGNECKPLLVGDSGVGRGLHSSTSQLNLSRVKHKSSPRTPHNTHQHPLSIL